MLRLVLVLAIVAGIAYAGVVAYRRVSTLVSEQVETVIEKQTTNGDVADLMRRADALTSQLPDSSSAADALRTCRAALDGALAPGADPGALESARARCGDALDALGGVGR